MKLAFNSDFFEHLNQSRESEGLERSKTFDIFTKLYSSKFFIIILWSIENIVSFLLSLDIPIYRSVISFYINNMRGLPSYFGNYMRSLYWRHKLGEIGQNVLIDQGVFFAYPKSIVLSDFCYIDKNVIVMSKNTYIGRRVHIAPNVFISGGGAFSIDDHACIATGSHIITSTEIIKNGSRCSGPMTRPSERTVLRSKVVIEQDSFIGAGATILPGVTVQQGAVVGAGAIISKNCDAWGVYVVPKTQKIAEREPVVFPR